MISLLDRVKRLKDAKCAADEEIAALRKKEEDKFNAEHAGLQGSISGDYAQMQKANDEALETVKKSYAANGSRTCQYLVQQVFTVKPALSNVQIAMLRAQSGIEA